VKPADNNLSGRIKRIYINQPLATSQAINLEWARRVIFATCCDLAAERVFWCSTGAMVNGKEINL
jgi:hypothetical protein